MPLIYAGIDEAGYGPLLGPLCVGLSVFEIDHWTEGQPAPDLWELLSRVVCRKPSDPKRRIAVDDSKALKLSNSSVTKHPLMHLERGVGAFLASLTNDAAPPATDAELFRALGVSMPREEWYHASTLDDQARAAAAPFPAGLTHGEVAIAASLLRGGLESERVCIRSLSCEVLSESIFNEIVEAAGTKAAATEAALVKHLWSVWELAGARPNSAVRVVCDRQGGRANYTPLLSRAFPDAQVLETHHSDTQSRYELTAVDPDGSPRHMHVLFLVESERHHLPVALASMAAKLVRETMMHRFNTYWRIRASAAGMKELKPTAGYRGDGQRWLTDLGDIATREERHTMTRRA
jgi:hypothetical protein